MSMPEARPNRLPGGSGGGSEHISALGADLRARREELGWSLPDVANWLRIREAYLLALEDGDPRGLPAPAYAVGFLRSYTHALGMDPEEAVRRFRRDARGALDRKTDLSFPQPVAERGVPVGIWVGIGLAVIVGSYVGYYHFTGAEPAPTRSLPPASELMPGVTSKGTTSPQIAAVMPEKGQAPLPSLPSSQSVPAATGANVDTARASGDHASPTVASESVAPTVAQPAEPRSAAAALPGAPLPEQPSATPSAPEPAQLSSPEAAPAPDTGAVVLHASEDAWVQIRDHSGASVFSRVLKTGETWQGDASGAPYRMTLGNAGGLTLSAGDVTTAPLGRSGAVRRNLEVTADGIRNGTLGNAASAPVPARTATPVMTSKPTTTHDTAESPESDRLNARQLEQTVQPR